MIRNYITQTLNFKLGNCLFASCFISSRINFRCEKSPLLLSVITRKSKTCK